MNSMLFFNYEMKYLSVEQNCVFQDVDNKDQSAYHLMGWSNDKLVAYTRIIPPGIILYRTIYWQGGYFPFSKRKRYWKRINGRDPLKAYNNLFGKIPIRIGAQVYLKKFYTITWFSYQTSDIYVEDGIEHIEMIRS